MGTKRSRIKSRYIRLAVDIVMSVLMFLLPKNHRFAKARSVRLSQMNGENMLLMSQIGFWGDIVREKMPDSHFLVQNERYSFNEQVQNSVLPCFVTDLSIRDLKDLPSDRVTVPIADPEVHVRYYLVCRRKDRRMFAPLFR